MPEIPVSSPLSYVGVFLLISGFFLVLAGLNIVRVEKITVKPGSKTWGFGIVLVVFGAAFLLPEIISSLTQHPTPTPTATLTVSLTNTPTQEIPRTFEPEPATNTPTVEPTDTLTPESIPPTIILTEVPIKVSPEQAVRDYYMLINQGRYDLAWPRLTDHFKSVRSLDYDDYCEWWMTVEQVNIHSLQLIEETTTYARLIANISYNRFSLPIYSDPYFHIDLIWGSVPGQLR